MAVTTIKQSSMFTRVQFTIPAESTLPISYTVDGITSSMTVIGALTNNAYVFQGLSATTSNGSVTINGTRWGAYDDDVTIELIFAETASSTATAIVEQSGE